MPNINIVNSMAQSQEVASTIDIDTQINNMFSDTKRKVLYDDIEDKENVLKFVSEINYLIEASDIELDDKVKRGSECYNNIKNNYEYIKSIEFIKFKIEEVLDEKVEELNK